MRGGTASCTVIIGDSPIGSPIVDRFDAAVVMNLPSMRKFAPQVAPGGLLLMNTSLLGDDKGGRDDIEELRLRCTSWPRGAATTTSSASRPSARWWRGPAGSRPNRFEPLCARWPARSAPKSSRQTRKSSRQASKQARSKLPRCPERPVKGGCSAAAGHRLPMDGVCETARLAPFLCGGRADRAFRAVQAGQRAPDAHIGPLDAREGARRARSVHAVHCFDAGSLGEQEPCTSCTRPTKWLSLPVRTRRTHASAAPEAARQTAMAAVVHPMHMNDRHAATPASLGRHAASAATLPSRGRHAAGRRHAATPPRRHAAPPRSHAATNQNRGPLRGPGSSVTVR